MLERLRLNQTARPLDILRYWHRDGSLNLNAPYQRGDVWGPVRQRNIVKSILLGVPIPSIILNDRAATHTWGDDFSFAIIDGKQRCTALLRFLLGELHVPGEWFDCEGDVTFNDISVVHQRGFRQRPIPFSEGQLPTLEDEKLVFDLVNFGGVPQGETDL